MPTLAELAEGLLSLEINTVLKDGMSAQKMPTAPHAVVEIVHVYWDYLCKHAVEFQQSGQALPPWADKISKSFEWGREPFPQAGEEDRKIAHPQGEPQPPGHSPDFLKGEPPSHADLTVLDDLREIAAWMAEMQLRIGSIADRQSRLFVEVVKKLSDGELQDVRAAARRIDPADRSILHRIRRNCDQLKDILKECQLPRIDRSTDPKSFCAGTLVPIRKAWDIGVEAILLQTSIQIDGDVWSRLQVGMDDPAKAHLHTLHANAVELSFKYWKWMIEALGQLAGSAVSVILGRRDA